MGSKLVVIYTLVLIRPSFAKWPHFEVLMGSRVCMTGSGSPGWGDLGSGGNRIVRALGVYICSQGGTAIAQSRCCYGSSPFFEY